MDEALSSEEFMKQKQFTELSEQFNSSVKSGRSKEHSFPTKDENIISSNQELVKRNS